MTRHSSLDDGCLQQGNSEERLSARFYYASSEIRDVLAKNGKASSEGKNPLIFQCKLAVYLCLQAGG
jgi:hypothetical protein